MSFSGIKETVIYVNDLKIIIHFYQSILNLRLYSKKEGQYAFFKIGEDMLLFFNSDENMNKSSLPAHFANGNQHFALSTSNEKYLEWKKFIKEEIGIEHIQKWGKGLESFYFRDPENNSVEIVMNEMWPD